MVEAAPLCVGSVFRRSEQKTAAQLQENKEPQRHLAPSLIVSQSSPVVVSTVGPT